METQKQSLKDFFKNHTFLFIIIMIFYVLLNNIVTSAIVSPFVNNTVAVYFLKALSKYIFAILPLFFMVKWKPFPKAEKKLILLGLLFGIPSLIPIACNLLPLTLISSSSFKVQWLCILAIIIFCLGIGLIEESACRGVLLPLLCEKWADKKESHL